MDMANAKYGNEKDKKNIMQELYEKIMGKI